MNLYGMEITISPHIQPVPKISLSKACPCSESVRNEFNSWLIEMFGTYYPCYIIANSHAIMHPKHAALLLLHYEEN